MMFRLPIQQPLIRPSCSCTSAGAHKHSGSVSSPFPCPSHCDPHPHRRVCDHHASLCARVRRPSLPCSDPAHCRCRYRSTSWMYPSLNRQARAACGRCSTLCCSSCPCPRCRRRLRPSGCLCAPPALLLAGGGWRWVCWGRRWFGGLFGCREWLLVLRFRSPVGGFAGGVALWWASEWCGGVCVRLHGCADVSMCACLSL